MEEHRIIETEVTIVNQAGLHTRPAATMVKLAAKYKSDFYITKDGIRINGKSIIGLMTLAAAQGSTLLLEFEGVDPDVENMCKDITDYINRGFDEV